MELLGPKELAFGNHYVVHYVEFLAQDGEAVPRLREKTRKERGMQFQTSGYQRMIERSQH